MAHDLAALFVLHDRLYELIKRSRTHKAKPLPGLTEVSAFHTFTLCT